MALERLHPLCRPLAVQGAPVREADRPPALAGAPAGFFMTVRDIGLWVRSAKADARLRRLRAGRGAAAAFDQLYRAAGDPYGTELPRYRYQRRKYEGLLSLLPRRRYRRALDLGCGLGSFTRKLAPFVDEILGVDISAEAVARARALSSGHPNVRYSRQDILGMAAPRSGFDLVVLADTLYYVEPLSAATLRAVAGRVSGLLAPGGLLLLADHYFFGFDAASRGTRAIHDAFRRAPALARLAEHRRAFYLATLLTKAVPSRARPDEPSG